MGQGQSGSVVSVNTRPARSRKRGAPDTAGREVPTATRAQNGLSDAEWDSFVAASPKGHILQTSLWGTLKTRFGWEVDRVEVVEGGVLVAGAQVLYRFIPTKLLSVAYVPMGPIVDWNDSRVVSVMMSALSRNARRRRALYLKVEPDRLDDSDLVMSLTEHGFRSAETIQPRRTIVLRLDCEEDEILARMKPKTRYNIRLAQRKGVAIRDGTLSDVTAFVQMLQDTGRRDGFSIHSADYYRAAYDLFVPHSARLLLAVYQGAVLAGMMVFVLGRRAWYMYGASSDHYRNLMPNYLLQWEAIKWARERGCLTYDLWGIPDQEEEVLEREFPSRSDGLWGVYRFKRGFGGQVVRSLGGYDAVYLRGLYRLYDGASGLVRSVWGETWHRHLSSG